MPTTTPRVFISYTGEDLKGHAEQVSRTLHAMDVLVVDHKVPSSLGQRSIEWCFSAIDHCDIVIVLVAHRYGWVPSVEDGGDGETSITWLEVKHARQRLKVVLPYLVEPDAAWRTDYIEALADTAVLPRLQAFKADLGRYMAGFFNLPASLDGPVSRNVRSAIDDLRLHIGPRPAPAVAGASRPSVRPWIFSRARPPTVGERLTGAHPKRVLSIDGPAVEVALTLAWLERLETLLRARYGEPDFMIGHYFDLIAGSGFGAIVAADLALGKPVADTKAFFRAHIGDVLSTRSGLLSRLHHQFNPAPLTSLLNSRFGSAPISQQAWCTGVMLVGARLERGLPCHFANHSVPASAPRSDEPPLAIVLLGCNSQLSYFPPLVVPDADGVAMALTNADIVAAGNPSLYVLQQIAAPPYAWRLGRWQLAMISIGGVEKALRRSAAEVARAYLLPQVLLAVNALLRTTTQSTRLLLGALSQGHGGDDVYDGALSFQRFDQAPASLQGAERELLDRLADMSWDERVEHWPDLERLGRVMAAAGMSVDVLHPDFDVRELSVNGLHASTPRL
ncbi:DUF4062 domain-containing protein [Variovorax sp. J31P179]|nr:DUF4062 domain-containing protein [Variovorax sp. J31P179]